MKKLLLIALSVFAISACTSSDTSTTNKSDPLFTAELGVQAFTFRNQFKDTTLTTEAILDSIVNLGFTEFETSAPRGIEPSVYKEMCDARGLKIVSTGGGFDQLTENPEEIIAKAKALGAKFVMCAWIPHEGDNFTLDDAKNAVDVFNTAGKLMAENGITFCYHDHGYEFKPNPDGEGTIMDYIIQNTNPEYVSFELDVLWAMHGGGAEMPLTLMEKYPTRWKLMHVKDLRKGVKGDFTGHTPSENDVPVGTGQGDWPAIIAKANEVGIEHFFIEDESEQEFVNIPKSIEYLKSLEK